MRKRIRGPIVKTRRRMLTFKQRVPKEVIYKMLSKLKEGDAMAMDGSPITWQEDGQVAPTNISSANLTYHIKLPKPMAVDRAFSLWRGQIQRGSMPRMARESGGVGRAVLCSS